MTLSFKGWLWGISVTCVLVYGCIFGIILIYKSKKTGAKLLSYTGLDIIFIGLTYLGASVDFLTILLTGKNTLNSLRLTLAFMWFPPLAIVAVYIGAELIIPKKKRYILVIYLVLGIIYELFLFLDPEGSYKYVNPNTPGEDLIDAQLILGSPLFILFIILFFSTLLVGFGALYKGFRSIGVLRKKFLFLALSVFFLFGIAINNNLFQWSILTAFFLISGNIAAFWFFYIALREEPDEPKKLRPKKDIKVKESLFRITNRPSQITEEEVSISKEKKICIVCKGKVLGINYICTECETYYCMKMF